ncbi:12568_t:CDS:2, partial [Cetraspora pellucida]
LRPFAEVTELLEGSKYAMISFMYSAIAIIKQGLLLFSKTSDMDFDSADDVFEDDVIYEDKDEDGVQEDCASNEKWCRIKINNPQDCTNLEGKIKSALYDAMIHYWNVPSDEAMLATLLDPWCKPLSFISESLKKKTHELLKTKYEESQVMYGIEENDNLQSQSNSLLASMFQNRCPRFEVSDYLGAQEIPWDQSTSTTSERLFSDARNTMTGKRTLLLPTTFEHLVCLKNNWKVTD